MKTQIPKNRKSKLIMIVTSGILLFQMCFFQVAQAGIAQEVGGEISKTAGNVADFLGIDTGGSGPTTSFVGFQGGLQAPNPAGYAAGLTKATDARTYILNVTNFALGFLGLIAVVVIIYGGFMYVTAAGVQEKAEKGKKSLTYAIIGIIMILGSFAIVNTVLQAPTGNDTPKGAADAGGGVSGGSVQHRFNILAARVQTMARDIVTAYEFHFDMKTDMNTATNYIGNAIAAMTKEKDMTLGKNAGSGENSYDSIYDDWTDAETPLSAPFDFFKKDSDAAISTLQNMELHISNTTVDGSAIKRSIEDLIAELNSQYAAAFNYAYSKATEVGCTPAKELKSCSRSEPNDPQMILQAFLETYKNPFTDGNTKSSVLDNFHSTINKAKNDLKEMYDLVAPITDVADDAFNKLVVTQELKNDLTLSVANPFENSAGSLEDLEQNVRKGTTGFKDNNGNNTLEMTSLLDTLAQLTNLYNVLKDIQFVDARVTASVVEGNAPLVVNFSSVGSLDPSGLTIDSAKQVSWDLNGNGNTNDAGDKLCRETNTVAVSCVYKKEGTYRVKLKITPSTQKDPNTNKTYDKEIGAGIATIDIKVNPPQTKINLKIDDKDIMKYDPAPPNFLLINKSSYIVPLSKASTAGITYDAQLTKAKDGPIVEQNAQGATVMWDFGDGSADVNNKTLLPASVGNLKPAAHKYMKAGDYNVSVELTDKNKITDRKLFTLKVATRAPAIDLSNHNVKVGEEVTFDGSNSISDNGAIKSFEWKVTPAPVPAIDPALLKQESFKWKFDQPNTYDVSLIITDDLGTSDAATDSFDVSSDAPIAQFSSDNPDKAQPGTFIFDGGKSFDPDNKDPKQVLDYSWEINGTKLTTKTTQDTADYSYDTTNPEKISVKFKKKDTLP